MNGKIIFNVTDKFNEKNLYYKLNNTKLQLNDPKAFVLQLCLVSIFFKIVK